MEDLSSERMKNQYLWLLCHRGILALFGIYAIVEKPFGVAVAALIVLGGFSLAGEAYYKSKVALEQQRLRVQKEREHRRRLAEEARLKFAAFKKAQEESAEKYMVFENETKTETAPASASATSDINPSAEVNNSATG